MLAALGERDGVLELRPDLARVPRLVPFIDAPAADPHDNEEYHPDDEVLVPLPQLLELFAADFLVDFAEDVGHV